MASKIAGPAECSSIENILKARNRLDVKHWNKHVGFLERDLSESFAAQPFTADQKLLPVQHVRPLSRSFSEAEGGFVILAPKLVFSRNSCIEVSLLFRWIHDA